VNEPQTPLAKPVTQRFVSISVTGLFVRLMERGVRKGFSDKERNVAGREYALSKTGPTPTSGRTHKLLWHLEQIRRSGPVKSGASSLMNTLHVPAFLPKRSFR